MNLADLSSLPDFPALEQLGAALWDRSQFKGAAVMVGAGFSRNAELIGRDVGKPPLWGDLREAMVSKLYKSCPEAAPFDPLRLAEEFRTYLGQAALNDFVREQVPDASWRPGRMHFKLMALPWADVLTTNYDTLLERASKRHNVVMDAIDLSTVRRPRIIKLHGSVDRNARLVIAEEDYRVYPRKSAAFVNTARQVFLENELCLIGFSGDDPNFLQWSGWVRDHLGDHARRIYLVGSLNLRPAKRRLLESRNIAPIDFSPLTISLPREEAEARACELFLDYLLSKEPVRAMDWMPLEASAYSFATTNRASLKTHLDEPTTAKDLLEKLDLVWKSDRESCPDWLVMPGRVRRAVAFGTSLAPWGYVRALEYLDRPERNALLERVAWRSSATLQPLPEEIESELAAIVKEDGKHDRELKVMFARILLREARIRRDAKRFSDYETLLDRLAAPGSDARAELVAQRLLWSRDGLDLNAVSDGVADLDGPDPAWRLLRLALHCECDEMDLANVALDTLRSDLSDRLHHAPNSVSVATRSAWTEILARAVHLSNTWQARTDSSNNESLRGYDPQNEINQLRQEVRNSRLERLKEVTGYEARFGPGAYKDNDLTIKFSSNLPGHEAEMAFRFADAACMPLMVGNIDILGGLACDSLDAAPQPTLLWHLRLLRAVWSHSSPLLETHFGRIAVARLDLDDASVLIDQILVAIQFWRPRAYSQSGRGLSDIQRLRVMLEALSRLVIRASPERAEEVFDLGCDLGVNVPHFWLYEQIGNVLKSASASIPPETRGKLALRCLEFPLPSQGMAVSSQWPDPITELFNHCILPVRPAMDARWRACVSTLLANAAKSGPTRLHAVNRLAYLHAYHCLEEQERQKFGEVLWSSVDVKKGNLPQDVDLFPHVIAMLPDDKENNPEKIARSYLYSSALDKEDFENRLYAVAAAARGGKPFEKLAPSRAQAIILLDGIASILDGIQGGESPFYEQMRRRRFQAAGRAIAYAILPALEPEDLNECRLTIIEKCVAPENGGVALSGLHELIRLFPGMERKVVTKLRRAITRGELNDISNAAESIGCWAELARKNELPPVPDKLKEAIISDLEVGVRPGLQPKLWCARILLTLDQMTTSQTEMLASAICDMQQDLDYMNMPCQGPEIVGITLAKVECVYLAMQLNSSGYACGNWLELVNDDPLPEVRFAPCNEIS
ncbi:SIR2 family NAD-dependent protein deacylase [Novacetimonas hansenii]|uniref:SIR2 family NAD-dependent protein deacylase n=1 Tax=Novacetimonas hansenii TaxID=436 RepID=UPI000789B1B0|nr:SIR2 family protein [Novacetimonas hansenii]RFO99730.1 hypothetical protein BGC30_10220 [Novacetimonas hansenii]WEQ58303.1 SIR2 family protein [Novacetimonas hansenii]CUW48555.1 hypothetical protein ATCC53582_02694 [Novacetimonas hansenii]